MNSVTYQAKIRNLAIPAVYLIVPGMRPNHILLMLRHNTGYMDGMWDLPSGHIEPGELPKKAVVREAKEEIGITVRQTSLIFVHASYRPKHDKTGDRADYVFEATDYGGGPEIREPEKCAEIRWVNKRKLPRNTVPQVRLFIGCWIKGIKFSELGLKWLRRHGVRPY